MCTLKEKTHICISGRKQVVKIKIITVDDKTKLKVSSLVVCLYFFRQIHVQPFSYLFVMPNREMTGRYSIYCTCIIYTLHCFPMYIIIVYFCSYFLKSDSFTSVLRLVWWNVPMLLEVFTVEFVHGCTIVLVIWKPWLNGVFRHYPLHVFV